MRGGSKEYAGYGHDSSYIFSHLYQKENTMTEEHVEVDVESHEVVDDPAEEKRVDEPDAVQTTVTTEVTNEEDESDG
jgi:hypothetical protein